MSNNEKLILTNGEQIQFRTRINGQDILSCECEGRKECWLPPKPLLGTHNFPIPIRELIALRNHLHQVILTVCGPPK